jgi:hypothetical protein
MYVAEKNSRKKLSGIKKNERTICMATSFYYNLLFWFADSTEKDADVTAGNEKSVESPVSGSHHSTFRFPGFLFSRKSEKSKHSSLKRAKSGIQFERKSKGSVTQPPTSIPTVSVAAATPTTPPTADDKQQQSASSSATHLTPSAADIEQRNK